MSRAEELEMMNKYQQHVIDADNTELSSLRAQLADAVAENERLKGALADLCASHRMQNLGLCREIESLEYENAFAKILLNSY
ncbi:hypothetical protein C4571_02030 [Candidatus Parcubacteria bacterium]|nr:MAG: hypothetical protein C4571_02030 [Candidatus Parcubacteria bacterium]